MGMGCSVTRHETTKTKDEMLNVDKARAAVERDAKQESQPPEKTENTKEDSKALENKEAEKKPISSLEADKRKKIEDVEAYFENLHEQLAMAKARCIKAIDHLYNNPERPMTKETSPVVIEAPLKDKGIAETNRPAVTEGKDTGVHDTAEKASASEGKYPRKAAIGNGVGSNADTKQLPGSNPLARMHQLAAKMRQDLLGLPSDAQVNAALSMARMPSSVLVTEKERKQYLDMEKKMKKVESSLETTKKKLFKATKRRKRMEIMVPTDMSAPIQSPLCRFSNYDVSVNMPLVEHFVEQQGPCCAAASVASALNVLINQVRTERSQEAEQREEGFQNVDSAVAPLPANDVKTTSLCAFSNPFDTEKESESMALDDEKKGKANGADIRGGEASGTQKIEVEKDEADARIHEAEKDNTGKIDNGSLGNGTGDPGNTNSMHVNEKSEGNDTVGEVKGSVADEKNEVGEHPGKAQNNESAKQDERASLSLDASKDSPDTGDVKTGEQFNIFGQEDLLEYYREQKPNDSRFGGKKYPDKIPSTAGVGNQLIMKALRTFARCYNLDTEVGYWLGIGKHKQCKVELSTAKSEMVQKTTRERAWEALKLNFPKNQTTPPRKILIHHTTNHYSLIFGYREWTVESGGMRGKVIRQCLTATYHQQPKSWMPWENLCDIIVQSKGFYTVMYITLRRSERFWRASEAVDKIISLCRIEEIGAPVSDGDEEKNAFESSVAE